MATRRPRDRQRGVVSTAAVVIILLLAVVAMGVVGVGRLAVVRLDAQRASDGAAVVAGDLMRQRGLPFSASTQQAAETVARGNSVRPMKFAWTVDETLTSLTVKVATSIDVDMAKLVWPSGVETAGATASAKISQLRFPTADLRLPKLMLVLDYSGSMKLPFSIDGAQQGQQAIEVLRASLKGLMSLNLELDYGAVFYSTGVIHEIPFSTTSPGAIVTTLEQGAGGSTGTDAALITATALIKARALATGQGDTGHTILLVSDGDPDFKPQARAAAVAAWEEGITIYTLEIARTRSSDEFTSFMQSLACGRDLVCDRSERMGGVPSGLPLTYRKAKSATDLRDQFRNVDSAPKCVVGPLNPAPQDTSTIRVYLDQGGAERQIFRFVAPTAREFWVANQEAFEFLPASGKVSLTKQACEAMTRGGAQAVVRYDGATLYE